MGIFVKGATGHIGSTVAKALACAVLCATAAGCAGCLGNECDFWSRCRGNVRQVCGGGVDQQINRKVREFACEGLNPFCVEDGGKAVCTADATARCTSSDRHCEGSVLVDCSTSSWETAGGFIVRTDCTSYPPPSQTCRDAGGGNASCG